MQNMLNFFIISWEVFAAEMPHKQPASRNICRQFSVVVVPVIKKKIFFFATDIWGQSDTMNWNEAECLGHSVRVWLLLLFCEETLLQECIWQVPN